MTYQVRISRREYAHRQQSRFRSAVDRHRFHWDPRCQRASSSAERRDVEYGLTDFCTTLCSKWTPSGAPLDGHANYQQRRHRRDKPNRRQVGRAARTSNCTPGTSRHIPDHVCSTSRWHAFAKSTISDLSFDEPRRLSIAAEGTFHARADGDGGDGMEMILYCQASMLRWCHGRVVRLRRDLVHENLVHVVDWAGPVNVLA